MPSAVLSARRVASGGLTLVSLDVEPALAQAYTAPGQYIQLETDRGAGYFVLANDVATAPWQLLVKNAGGAAEALCTLSLGAQLAVSSPLGAGFSMDRMRGRHVVIAVVSSALGVARSVLGARLAERSAAATHLFLGLRAATDLPIPDELRAWSERGLDVVLCLSRSELHLHPEVLPGARRVAGYVQLALYRALEAGDVSHGALVIAAGPHGMLTDMRDLAIVASPSSGAVLAGPRIEVLTNT